MESNQDESGNDTENVSDEALESLGVPKESAEEESSQSEGQSENMGGPASFQKRLTKLKRSHKREIQEMQARMAEMQSQLQQPNQSMQSQQGPYPAGNSGGIDDAIHKAVGFALQHKEMEERRIKEAAHAQQLASEYQGLQSHLDKMSDKYEDFDDIVRGNAPFTETMRDAAVMLPKKGPGSAGEVLYQIGKNPEELSRIASLPKHKQAQEMIALSHALISGGEKPNTQSQPLGKIKSNPVVNSAGVSEKTPISDIRARMKEGKFK